MSQFRAGTSRRRDEMLLRAHIRSAFSLSNKTYGCPRMVHELRDAGLARSDAGALPA